MLSKFQIFHLNKMLSEMYTKYYVPYCMLNEAKGGGDRKRETAAKGKPVEPHDDDREFIMSVKRQIPGVSLPKVLMVYYQLLGHGNHIVRKYPGKAEEDPKNAIVGYIDHKSDPDENGVITANISFPGLGKRKESATVKFNVKSLKERLKSAGYDPDNQQQLASLLDRSYPTWEKAIKVDKEAPADSKYNFALKVFSPDYHATQVASSPQFKQRMDSDSEFSNRIAEAAVRAAAVAAGINVSNVNGFSYSGGKSNKKTGVSDSDLDDAIQSAVSYLSSQSATSPEKLDDMDWVRQKLSTGAMNHIKSLTTTKDRATGDQGSEKGGSLDGTASKGWTASRDDDEDAYRREDDPNAPPEEVQPEKLSVRDIGELEYQLRYVKSRLADRSVQGDVRQRLVQHGMQIEDELELAKQERDAKISTGNMMNRYNKKPTAPPIVRKKVDVIPDKIPDEKGWSMGYDDDDIASPEELSKYRRRMSAEGFNFMNYLKFKESNGANNSKKDMDNFEREQKKRDAEKLARWKAWKAARKTKANEKK